MDFTDVSIVMPCYNYGAFLPEALESVAEAAAGGAEVLVVDDGSDDEQTLQALENLPAWVTLIRREKGGPAAARNSAIEICKGKYIYPLDADDKANLEFIKEALGALQHSAEFDVVFADRIHFGEESLHWEARVDQSMQWYVNRIPATALYRKPLWERVGGYDEAMVEGYEDWEFWLHSMVAGARFTKAKNPAYWYRVRSQSMVRTISVPHHQKLLAYMHSKHHSAFLKQYIGQVNALKALQTDYRLLCKAMLSLVMRKLGLRK